jgi:transglutaminase-like putative cysteine protease
LAIILVVSLLPAPSAAPLGAVGRSLEGVANAAGDEFSRLFNGLPSRRHVHTITFESSTRFRGNPNLTPDLLFTVRGEAPAYWRARTYTTYTGSGWDSGRAVWGEFVESGADDRARESVEYEFNVTAATDTFFTAGLPSSFDEPVEGLALPGALNDVLQVRFKEGREYFPTRTNVRYISAGNRSIARASELLRTEPPAYPPNILSRYTQLPDSLPDRVADLALDVTGEIDTVYEKALAVQQYLMQIPYNLDISGPPSGVDGVDYFLFNIKQGYCDYYASAMVVMLRTLGIPARYVLGYTSGGFNIDSGAWEVLQLNYHAWVEVYFPSYGWIQFEPTPPSGIEFGGQVNPSNPPPLNPDIDIDGPIPEDEDELGGAVPGLGGTPTAFVTLGRVFAGVVAAAIAFLAVAFYRWWWRLGRYPKADELYAKLGRLATLLGVPPDPSYTPSEFAALLSREVPEHAGSFETLAGVYASRRYGGKTISMSDIRRAQEAWETVRWPLVRRLFRVRPA